MLAFAPALACASLVARHATGVPVAPDGDALASTHGFAGDPRLGAALAYALVLATALCVHGLLRASLGAGVGALYGTTFLANLLVFSPIQWENLLWAARAGFFLPAAALSAGLLVLASCRAGWPKPLAWALLASAASGAAWLTTGGELSARAALEQPGAVLRFCATILGSPFSRTTLAPPRDLAPALGVLVVALFAAGAAYGLGRRRDVDLRSRVLPWVVLGGYGLGSCVLTALGSHGIAEPDAALLSAHTSLSLVVCLAALPLGVLAAADVRRNVPASRGRLRAALEWAPAVGAGVLLAAAGLGWLVGIQAMGEWKSARLQLRTSLVFLERGEGFEPYALGDPLTTEAGRVEAAWAGGDRLILRGYAWLPEPDRRADGVLLTARSGDGPQRVIALAELRGMLLPAIPEHDHIYNDVWIPRVEDRAAWDASVPGEALPRAPRVRVEAFAVDSEAMRLRRLPGPVVVHRARDGLRVELGSDDAP